jgi:outer membrane lipoprotein-sorting protein
MIRTSSLRLLRLLLLLLAVPALASAQTADEVLDHHVAAKGGLDRWRAVRSLTVSGTLTAFSETGPFVTEWKRPGHYRTEQTLLGKKVVVATDGTAAWWVHPLVGVAEPAALPEEEAKHLKRDAEYESPLIDAKAKGIKVEFPGKGDVDGQPALKLDVTRKDGAKETWFLDPKTFLEIARLDRKFDMGRENERWTYYSDFRTVDGLVIPHRIEEEFSIRHVATDIEKVQVNPEIDPARFKMPAKAE